MQALSKLLRRSLGFGRTEPASPLAKGLRRTNQLLSVIAVTWLALHLFPQALFAHSITAAGVTLYARDPLPEVANERIERALKLVANSELATDGRAERVFVCNNRWLFTLLAPTSSRAFAFTMPITGNIFVADADFVKDATRSSAPTYNTRSVSGVVAHEITHNLIRKRLGLIRSIMLPKWVAEGYCEYVAHESSFPEAEGLRLLAAGRADPSPSFRYFRYRQMVRHLMEDEELNFDQLAARARDEHAVEAETLAALRVTTR